MKRQMEKIAILSLSLLLVSTYSVSSVLPAMQEFFADRSRAQVEQLISVTSFAIMTVIILNNWISKYISQRVSITLGVLLMAVCGSMPLFVQDYSLIFLARIFLGVGIGLINAHAINMINERYEGEERSTLLGFRSAAEVLGNAVLTLIAGWLLTFGWTRAFAVYLAGIPVLILYYCFVPPVGTRANHEGELKADKKGKDTEKRVDTFSFAATAGYRTFLFATLILGFVLISMNSCMTMRIPVLTLERQLGTDSQSSMVLSLMLVMGIVAGVGFGKILRMLGRQMMSVCMIVLGAGLLLLAGAGHMILLMAGAMVCGLSHNMLVTVIFQRVSEKLPGHLMTIGTTFALVGCNLGAFSSPYVMKLISLADDSSHAPLVVYAVVCLILGAVFWIGNRTGKE